jgi:HD-like signal output (HDOD) protein
MKKRILFVDDEPAVLELFDLMFKSMASEWEILLARSGQEALALMEEQPVEVIVSDMRMPGMNGAQLLNEVMRLYPETTRLILSGYAEQEAVAKCVGAAHQYLTKPCSVAVLRSTLTQVVALEKYLHNEKLKALVARMGVMPSLPSLYFRVLQELQSPTASVDRIGEIVAMDLGMTAKILQMVNSAFFGSARKISNPTEAVQLLGVGTVRSLALYIHAFDCFDAGKLGEFSFERLWNHSASTGVFARKIAQKKRMDLTTVDEAFIAGLLHDIGKLMMVSNLPDEYRQALKLSREKGVTISDAEQEVFGATHSDTGAYLLGLWGLPIPIVEAVAFHHHPSHSIVREFSPLAAVHVANVLEHEATGGSSDGASAQLDEEYLKALGFTTELQDWRALMKEWIRGS